MNKIKVSLGATIPRKNYENLTPHFEYEEEIGIMTDEERNKRIKAVFMQMEAIYTEIREKYMTYNDAGL